MKNNALTKKSDITRNDTVPKDCSSTCLSAVKHILSHFLAALFWMYVILKLFVLNVDEVLVREFFPEALWLVEYRGVVLIGIFAVIAIVTWGFNLLGWVLHILFYPLILIFWHIPSWLVKRRAWTLTVALIAATASAIRSLRWTIIVAGFFTVGSTLIAAGISGSPVISGMILISVCLVIIYVRTMLEAFRSSLDMFSSQSLDKLWAAISKNFTLTNDVRALEVDTMTEAQRNTWIANLQMSVLYGRVCYFIADKLRTLRQGRITAAIAAVKVAGLFIVTVIAFSLLSLGLHKVDHSQYIYDGVLRGFDFLWYAFQASFMNGVSEIVPKGALARALFMINELTTGLILFVIVVFFLTGVQAARNADQMDSLIEKIREHAEESERFVADNFGLTIEAAVNELTRLQAGMLGWILKISPELDPNHRLEE